MSKVDPTLNLTPTPAERKARPDIWGPRHTPAEEQARVSWEPPNGLAETIAQKTAEIEAASLCQWDYNPALRSLVLQEVSTRCASQDAQWGGPEHDDLHTKSEWLNFINDFLLRARYGNVTTRGAFTPKEPEVSIAFENHLIDVAALAVQAIQSSRRKRACPVQ